MLLFFSACHFLFSSLFNTLSVLDFCCPPLKSILHPPSFHLSPTFPPRVCLFVFLLTHLCFLLQSPLFLLYFSSSLSLPPSSDAGCYGLWAAMGLFCLSRHLRLFFRSQPCSGCVERVRACAVVMCSYMCEVNLLAAFDTADDVARLPYITANRFRKTDANDQNSQDANLLKCSHIEESTRQTDNHWTGQNCSLSLFSVPLNQSYVTSLGETHSCAHTFTPK